MEEQTINWESSFQELSEKLESKINSIPVRSRKAPDYRLVYSFDGYSLLTVTLQKQDKDGNWVYNKSYRPATLVNNICEFSAKDQEIVKNYCLVAKSNNETDADAIIPYLVGTNQVVDKSGRYCDVDETPLEITVGPINIFICSWQRYSR